MISSTDKHPYYEVFLDEDWKIDSSTLLKPNVSLVFHDENPKFISKTPEIIFEILSLSTA